MTPELAAAASSALALAFGVFAYLVGNRHGKSLGDAVGFNRGVHDSNALSNALAKSLAEKWINRPFQPLAHYKNKQHWMELARRECHQLLADDLCKAFDIETPTRTVENG